MVSFVDSVLVGRTGTVPLAAVSLGVNSTNVILILGIGLSMGSVPLVAAADGRHDQPGLARLLVSSVWLSVLAGLRWRALASACRRSCISWASRPP